jgi:hypothetical protein
MVHIHTLKKKWKFIATFQFITLRSELIVELLSIENIRDRQKLHKMIVLYVQSHITVTNKHEISS